MAKYFKKTHVFWLEINTMTKLIGTSVVVKNYDKFFKAMFVKNQPYDCQHLHNPYLDLDLTMVDFKLSDEKNSDYEIFKTLEEEFGLRGRLQLWKLDDFERKSKLLGSYEFSNIIFSGFCYNCCVLNPYITIDATCKVKVINYTSYEYF